MNVVKHSDMPLGNKGVLLKKFHVEVKTHLQTKTVPLRMTRLQQEVFSMTSITYKDLLNSRNNYLKVPEGTESMSTLEVAL